MNEKEFSRALGEINEKYLDEAIDYRKKRNYFYLIHVAALAACLCLVLVGALEIGKKQNKREISGSVPGVSDDNSNGINSLEDAINHFKDTQIIWGDGDRNESGDIEDDSAAKPEPSAPEDANPPLSYLSWNGINVSADLVDMYNNNASKEVVFAVGAYYIEYSGMNLSDFEYNGVTFSQLQDEIAEIEALPQKLEILLKVAYYYGTEDGMYLESLIEEIGEDGKEFANSYFEDGKYDVVRIEKDFDECFEKLSQLRSQLRELRDAYTEKFMKKVRVDLSVLGKCGYYVVEENGYNYVFATASELETIKQALEECGMADKIDKIVFTTMPSQWSYPVDDLDNPIDEDDLIDEVDTEDITSGTQDETETSESVGEGGYFPDDYTPVYDENAFLEGPQEMKMVGGVFDSIPGICGAYSWICYSENGEDRAVAAEAVHPLMVGQEIEFLPAGQEKGLLIFGDTAPDEIVVRCWNYECMGDSTAPGEAAAVDGFIMELKPGKYIYDVICTWNRERFEGVAHYYLYIECLE